MLLEEEEKAPFFFFSISGEASRFLLEALALLCATLKRGVRRCEKLM